MATRDNDIGDVPGINLLLLPLAFVFCLTVFVFFCCLPAVADENTSIAYTANLFQNTTSVIDMGDNSLIATVYGGNLPAGIAVSSDYGRIFFSDSGSNTVAVVNTSTYYIVKRIAVGKVPYGIAISPDGNTVYVANNEGNTVSIINTTNMKVNYTVGVGRGPYGLRINPVNGDVYVVNSNDGTISVIRGKDVVATIPVGKFPTNGLAVTPDGSRLLVANTESDNVSIINTSTFLVIDSIYSGEAPGGIAISPEGWYAYIANTGSGNISILQLSDNTIRVSHNIEKPALVALSPDGKVLYVTTLPDNRITTLNSATGEITGTIDVTAVDIGTMLAPSVKLVDMTPPITTLTRTGINNSEGYYIDQVVCNLTSYDYPGGVRIDDIEYSLDGYSWVPYSGNITLKGDRLMHVYFRATDKYGNVEIIKSERIIIIEGDTATATPTAGPSLPPKPTALPPEEIFTVTPMPTATITPQPTAGFESILTIIGMLSVIYYLRKD